MDLKTQWGCGGGGRYQFHCEKITSKYFYAFQITQNKEDPPEVFLGKGVRKFEANLQENPMEMIYFNKTAKQLY